MKNLTPILLILIAVGLYFFYIDPMYSEDVKQKEQTRDQYTEAIETTQQLAVVLGTHVDTYNSFSDEDLERLDKVVPEEIDPLRLIVDVNSVARNLGLKISEISVSEGSGSGSDSEQGPQQQGGAGFSEAAFGESEFEPVNFETALPEPALGITKVSFGVTTTYESFVELLRALEKSLRIFDVVSVQIGGATDGEGGEGGAGNTSEETESTESLGSSEDELDFSVELQTYSLKKD